MVDARLATILSGPDKLNSEGNNDMLVRVGQLEKVVAEAMMLSHRVVRLCNLAQSSSGSARTNILELTQNLLLAHSQFILHTAEVSTEINILFCDILDDTGHYDLQETAVNRRQNALLDDDFFLRLSDDNNAALIQSMMEDDPEDGPF